jgi:Asp-tRNA(Asn)/Glu-tRNA(Gln) amidotransferase A subunit family amidase
MTDLPYLSATAMVDQFRRRSLSPTEICEAVIAHIARWEPRLQALYAYDPEAARAAAKAATERWAKGAPQGPLDGVPVTIKENIATKGTPMPLGCAATDHTPAAADAPPAARLRESGAVILGKTTMPDYGMLSSGLSSFHPLTRNPWNLALNPGGSSAGAGAAGAAGYGPIHLGTDIGGSVRLPAGWCALVGLKPSLGRIPIDPPYVGRVAGPMTRSVADNALAMSVLAAPDWRDGTSLPAERLDWTMRAVDVAGLRVGLQLEIGAGLDPMPETRAAVEAAARLFEAHGATIVPVRPILTRAMLDGLDQFWRARAWSDVEPLPAEKRAAILPYIREWAESGAKVSGAAAVRGFGQTFAMRKAAAAQFQQVDVLLSPTSPVPTFPAELASPIHDPERPFEHIGFTVVWNMSEQPAVSINCGFTKDHLPIGLQIVGRRFDDVGVLRLAHTYETWRGADPVWPKP